MDNQIIVLVDMDGVQADLEKKVQERWEEQYPDKPWPTKEQRKSHRMEDNIPEYKPQMWELMNDSSLYYDLKPVEGAIDGLRYLSERFLTYTCTKPSNWNPECAWAKMLWTEKHLGDKWRKEQMIIIRDKTAAYGHYLLDDSPSIVPEGKIQPPVWEQVVYDQPYNQQMTNRLRITWNKQADKPEMMDVKELAYLITHEAIPHRHRLVRA